MNQYRGIALVQVLIIVACISIIALFMSSSSLEKVQIAQLSLDKANAQVLTHSKTNVLMFELLTQPWQVNKRSDEHLVQKWNFYGEQFQLDNKVSIEIQDLSGLINANYLVLPVLKAALLNIDSDEARAQQVIDLLLDWLDDDENVRFFGNEESARNGSILDSSDLNYILKDNMAVLSNLQHSISLFGVSHFNPKNSPVYLLELIFGKNKALQLHQLRKEQTIPYYRFDSIMGTQDWENVRYISGQIMKISIESSINEAKSKSGFIVELKPYETLSNKPFNIYERTE